MTPAVGVSRVSLGMRMVLTNDAVPEPVGGSRDGDTLGPDRQLEDLADDDPACRTPGAGKYQQK